MHAGRRLKHYFQAHPIVVLTNQPLKQIWMKPEASGRLVKWAIELGEHDITFSPRNSVKGQVLADFISEMPNVKEQKPTLTTDSERLVKRIKISEKDWWTREQELAYLL